MGTNNVRMRRVGLPLLISCAKAFSKVTKYLVLNKWMLYFVTFLTYIGKPIDRMTAYR